MSEGTPAAKNDRACMVQVNPASIKITDVYDLPSSSKNKLGCGSYGSVEKGTHKDTKQLRAVKRIEIKKSMSQADKVKMEREVDIMKEVDHPNIVRLYETYQEPRNMYLVMELCDGGELFDRIIDAGFFSEADTARTMREILSAVFYLHERMITHRDLKPENFLLESKKQDSALKVIDFGLSCKFEKAKPLKTKAGTPYYVAPQVLNGSYNEKADVWSCGVLMYVLLCGYPPFYGDADPEILAMVRKGEFDFPEEEWADVSKEAKDLIGKLMKFDESKRITAEQSLQEPWFEKASASKGQQLGNAGKNLVQKLRAFRGQSKLKKVALTVIAMNTVPETIKELRATFQALDVNGDGTLTYAEVIETMKKHKIEVPEDLLQIMKDVDSDGNGSIDYTEFVAATLEKNQFLKEDAVYTAFRAFDLDGDGKITSKELTEVLGADGVGTHFDSNKIAAMIKEADSNGDGMIDFDEFKAAMKNEKTSVLSA